MLKAVGQRLDDGRWFAPSAERNKGPILARLERTLPRTGLVLEIGSGTGQHVAHFAGALPQLTWQPSDADAGFRESIRAWIDRENLGNVRAPLDLDVRRLPWPVASAEAVLCINNLTSRPQATVIRVPDEFKGAQTDDLFGGQGFPKVSDDGTLTLTLGSRDFFWLRLAPGAARG